MIRRNVEYVIVCDARDCPGIGGMAFGSLTAASCAEDAKENGWLQVSARRWYCPDCQPATTNPGDGEGDTR